MVNKTTFQFNNTYCQLPGQFYDKQLPVPVNAPELIYFNAALVEELNIDVGDDLAEVFAGNKTPLGAEPISLVYAGHQFGGFVPRLGDGRAVLLGEIIDKNGVRKDVQLKGSGKTKYSRGGDGRSPIGSVIREFLVSEAMHALGIPTTRALAMVETGENVYREEPLRGGVLTRAASSHIRIGTFEYFAAQGDVDSVRILADYTIHRHYPQIADHENKYLEFYKAVLNRQAQLVAKWMHVGFIHGVMNTDNVAISGDTIDYGPCAFMNGYQAKKVFSSIDRYGRYAFSNQMPIMQWNLARFGECLLSLIDDNQNVALRMVNDELTRFSKIFNDYYYRGMLAKIGLETIDGEAVSLVDDLLQLMENHRADFTLTFVYLSESVQLATARFLNLFNNAPETLSWIARWQSVLQKQGVAIETAVATMRATNPVVIPRNYWVQNVIDDYTKTKSLDSFRAFLQAITNPFDYDHASALYTQPPKPEEEVTVTFCGT